MSEPLRTGIVVALDLSEYAEIVLEHALDQALRYEAPDLHFLTIASEPKLDGVKSRLAALVCDGLDVLRQRSSDWHAHLHVRSGRPAEEIVNLAGEVSADLIVIGRFGRGSIVRRVVENAPCATLVIGLVDHPVEAVQQCPDCVRVRAQSDGERWFCDAHSAPDRASLAILPTTTWTGGSLMW